MEKMVTKMPISYRYVAERKGAHYTIDGKHFMGHGDLLEIAVKVAHGLEGKKDACTPFYKASDIPEYSASVKSADCSLFNMKLADSFEASAEIYLDRDVSTSFWWAQDVGEELWSWDHILEPLTAYIPDLSAHELKFLEPRVDFFKKPEWQFEKE